MAFPSGFSPPKRKRVSAGSDSLKAAEPSSQPPSESLLHRLAGPSTNKAGVTRNAEEVRNIIYQSSKGGHYFKNEQRKDQELTAQITAQLEKLQAAIDLRDNDLSTEERSADRILSSQESKRDLSQSIVVVDCDAFYASVEELDDPSLKGKAFGVGEGVLTTASYEARKFGCRSAMPGYIAKKLCPHLIFVKLDFTKYTAASNKVMAVIARYDPTYSAGSLDEAYMNMTPYLKRTGMTAAAAVQQMREEIKQETGLTVSAGCGPNVMLAKIAADVNKPDGQCVVEPSAEACKAFMQDMSVRKIPGIGRVTERWLEALGVVKCSDIFRLRGKLILAKGDVGSTWLLRSYLGIAGNVVERAKREDRRGVGHETTFSAIWKPEDLDNKLREIADSLGADLARLRYSGRTLTLKLKLESYEVLSRSKTIDGVIFASADQLYKYGKVMLENEIQLRAKAFDEGKPIKGKGRDLKLRLMGLKVSNLLDLDSDAPEKKKGLHKWAVKTNTSKVKAEDLGPIDLTELEDSDEEDGFEEIFLEAAPCSVCQKTFPFADDVYNNHVKECLELQRNTIIDLSKSSQGDDWNVKQEEKEDVKPVKRAKASPPIKPAVPKQKDKNAFTTMMKQSQKSKKSQKGK